MLALRSLTELRDLCIEGGVCDDAADADILKRLTFTVNLPRLPATALRTMDEALPQL
jgi:hypothetical protein